MSELREALDKAVGLYLPKPGHPARVQLAVTEKRAGMHAAC
jgi:hypothetical protein